MSIGILALQGGFREHAAHLRDCGVAPIFVKTRADLSGCTGLIIPGGESSALRRLMAYDGLDAAVAEGVKRGSLCVWGTCAGAILCAAEVLGESPCLGVIEVSIERNVFGSQLDSFMEDAEVSAIGPGVMRLVYIRAPGIRRVWGQTRVLHRHGDVVTAAENARVLVTSFHPELSPTLAFHRYFVAKCGLRFSETGGEGWEFTRWMTRGGLLS